MATQTIPYRQIRAHYTSTTITVYQAYNSAIAQAAVEHQKLNASPKFSTTRMTWIKPSWAWMLYRSGYSYKDPGQARIIAIVLTHSTFLSLLRKAVVSSHDADTTDSGAKAKKEGRSKPINVRVQWDPERTINLEKLPYRSIQIGIPGGLVDELVEGTVKIEDVTERARELKKMLDENVGVSLAELVAMGLALEENVFEVDEELRAILSMDQSVLE
ncbi:hypothetical protein CC86DRAFT_308105 [Ophiobolus disseminans]|uniref:ATP-dependent RNA helicase DHX8 n=1 Tax=Ophiobolus disseminans TaxID=1469910 RepID=A0A6A6ZCY9_9PLEO|nr:hypothetical protein CC86DRAFT_308105 [Ophiobolus disseminans]